MKTYYVYILTDPVDGLVKYVGCTVNPKARLGAHIHQLYNAKPAKIEWIVGLRNLNTAPTMSVLHTCQTVEQARVLEKEAFDTYNTGNLLCADPGSLAYTKRPCRYKRH